MTTWVTWGPRGRDPYTNPRSRVAHATSETHVTNGGFPLACGRWAPDGLDATITVSYGRRCRRCERALALRDADRMVVGSHPRSADATSALHE